LGDIFEAGEKEESRIYRSKATLTLAPSILANRWLIAKK
jgi:hypothetical protein